MASYIRETLPLTSIAPDRIPADAPAEVWNNGQNVLYRNGESVRSRGDAPTLPGAAAPLCMVYVEPFDQGFWVYANASGIWAHDGTDQFDITPAAGWTGDVTNAVWTADVINGLAVINCSTRTPVWWSGEVTDPCVALPGWPAGGRCLAMRAHKNFLFAVGMVSEGAQRVRWSDAAEAGIIPQEWEPSASNLAGFVDLAPLSSPCVDGLTMRDSFFVYKRKSIWSLDFVGGNAVFSARKLFAEIGAADANAVTAGPNDEHLFIGSDGDAHVTDGAQVLSILDGRAQRTFYGDFSAAQHLTFSAVTLQREKTGFLIYPAAGETLGTLALVYDFASGDLGMREMPHVTCAADGQELRNVGSQNTWDGAVGDWNSDSASWNSEISAQSVEDCLIGGSFGFRVLEQADEGTATDIAARIEKTGLSFGDAQRRKMIKAVWPKLEGTEGDVVTFRVGGQEKSGGPVQWGAEVDYTIGQEHPVECFVQGRFMAIEVSSQGGDPWRLGTLDVEYRGVGGW